MGRVVLGGFFLPFYSSSESKPKEGRLLLFLTLPQSW
jgi:hypothetical protein